MAPFAIDVEISFVSIPFSFQIESPRGPLDWGLRLLGQAPGTGRQVLRRTFGEAGVGVDKIGEVFNGVTSPGPSDSCFVCSSEGPLIFRACRLFHAPVVRAPPATGFPFESKTVTSIDVGPSSPWVAHEMHGS